MPYRLTKVLLRDVLTDEAHPDLHTKSKQKRSSAPGLEIMRSTLW